MTDPNSVRIVPPELPPGVVGWDIYATGISSVRRTWWQRLLRRPARTEQWSRYLGRG